MLHVSPSPALHYVFETLAYTVAFQVYRVLRRRRGDVIETHARWNVIAAAAVGALIGGRTLDLLDEAPGSAAVWSQLFVPSGGKTIVGGLLGAWIAVELVKRWTGVTARTGDLFAIPLCIGIVVGRIGCFLAGTSDNTFGNPTSLPWAVDFGDGIPRHPTQLYEIAFVSLLAGVLLMTNADHGRAFRIFMAAYLGWRLLIDFLKPDPAVAGMNMIQWACVAGLVGVAMSWKSPEARNG